MDHFSWSSLGEQPRQFVRTIQHEKKKLEDYHLSKKKQE